MDLAYQFNQSVFFFFYLQKLFLRMVTVKIDLSRGAAQEFDSFSFVWIWKVESGWGEATLEGEVIRYRVHSPLSRSRTLY